MSLSHCVIFVVAANEANSDPCSDVFAGRESMSEPEVRAVSEFILSRNGTWLVFMTLHSYSQLWMAPWGYTDDRPQDYSRLVSAQDTSR